MRAALYVDITLHRRHLWSALEELHRMRVLIIELFARTRAGVRAYPTFEAQASTAFKEALGATLPHYSVGSIQTALARLLDLLEGELEAFKAGKARLTSGQRAVIAAVRARQAALR